jgi:hypothetical protein
MIVTPAGDATRRMSAVVSAGTAIVAAARGVPPWRQPEEALSFV